MQVNDLNKNLKLSAMKKLIWIGLLLTSFTGAFGQKSIDELFRKYADSDGFVTVTINGNLLKLARAFDDDRDLESIPGDIYEIKILAQEDKEIKTENFYDFVIKDLNLNDYEEFMRIKQKDEDLRMLVRTEGNKFKEFLLIGGGDDNVLIQIKGNLTIEDAKRISSDLKTRHGRSFLKADFD